MSYDPTQKYVWSPDENIELTGQEFAIVVNAVTISDAVKTYDEYTVTDVNQTFSRTYLKNGLAYLIKTVYYASTYTLRHGL